MAIYESVPNGRFQRDVSAMFSFILQKGRLRRIAVNLGEGTDRQKAVAAVEQLYKLLQRDYGAVTIPEDKSSGERESRASGGPRVRRHSERRCYGHHTPHSSETTRTHARRWSGQERSFPAERSGFTSPLISTNAPNHAIQRTTDRSATNLEMTSTLSPRPAPGSVRRCSSFSR